MQQYNATNGQSYSDVCLNTYGSMDYYVKMLNDNGASPNALPTTGVVIDWDTNLVVDQAVYNTTTKVGVTFATHQLDTNNSFYQISGVDNPSGGYVAPVIPSNAPTNMYYDTFETQYLATGGETSVTIVELIGSSVVQITREIKPMLKADYSFEPTSGVITFNNGIQLNQGEELFIIYKKLITK